MSAPRASEIRSPLRASSDAKAWSRGEPRPAWTRSAPRSTRASDPHGARPVGQNCRGDRCPPARLHHVRFPVVSRSRLWGRDGRHESDHEGAPQYDDERQHNDKYHRRSNSHNGRCHTHHRWLHLNNRPWRNYCYLQRRHPQLRRQPRGRMFKSWRSGTARGSIKRVALTMIEVGILILIRALATIALLALPRTCTRAVLGWSARARFSVDLTAAGGRAGSPGSGASPAPTHGGDRRHTRDDHRRVPAFLSSARV